MPCQISVTCGACVQCSKLLEFTPMRQTDWLPEQNPRLMRPLDVYHVVNNGWMIYIGPVPKPAVGCAC
jgi:hypothetical protein